ncbi:MAG: tetratricopeptide repeat protein [Bacteroidetes bacterium]|nr:tetratricopeptide repeat protein [Bacteroidota bacterium]
MAKQQKTAAQDTTTKSPINNIWIWIVAIVLFTLACYAPVFSDQKEFTNWDDDQYVTDQPLVKSTDGETISELFKPSTAVMLNYHPLTMLTLAWDYEKGYDEATNTVSIAPFIKTNIILHLLNVALVFLLVYRLGKKKIWTAGVAALLFGIHPMHVESVAWISERKDVLYCFFFLLSCLAYLRYLDKQKTLWLGITFVLFVASCLSKAMAVPLPLVLLLIDYLEKRKITAKVLAEKLPFLVVSVWIGITAVHVQAGALEGMQDVTFLQRILYAAYGFTMYWVKLIAPIQLSAFYPYPVGGVPGYYYLTAIIALAIIITPIIIYLRKKDEGSSITLFSVLFFAAMTGLVLQFVSVGQALMADRYSYVSYIGPLFIAGSVLNNGIDNPKFKNIAIGIIAVFVIAFAALTYNRIQVWENSKTLWTDVIAQYPYQLKDNNGKTEVTQYGVKTAYKNLGEYYADHQQFDSAYHYYDILVRSGSTDAEVWSNIGNLHFLKKQIPEALAAFDKAIALNPKNEDNYLKRGLIYMQEGKNTETIAEMDKILKLNPQNEQAKAIKQRCLSQIPK